MPALRKCLYDILGVERDADDSQIKKAYRQQALANHPDKNPDNQQQAAELFKQVQHAYDVLSDTHERAWYDSHRTQILRGNDTLSNPDQPASPSSATDVDIFAYFASTCYEGFGTDSESFFTVYADVFDKLWTEEREAADEANAQLHTAPPFGGCNAEWDTVRNFYREWESFTSVKSFSFADKWKLTEAPNRDYRRAMERENKKERAKLKKEFVSTVRALVSFVKKRDPRVAAHLQKEELERQEREIQSEQRKLEKAQQRKNLAAQTRAARDQALEEDAQALDEILASHALDERMERRKRKGAVHTSCASDLDEEGEDADDDAEDEAADANSEDRSIAVDANDGVADSDNESEEEDLYCVACRKLFRTDAQKIDHERSKKHKSAVAKLRKQVQEEEEQFLARQVGNINLAEQRDSPQEGCTRLSHEDEIEDVNQGVDSHDAHSDTELAIAASSMSRKKQKKRNAKQQRQQTVDDTTGKEKSTTNGTDLNVKAGGQLDEKVNEDQGAVLSKKEKRRLKKKNEANASAGNKSLQCNVCSVEFPSRTKLMKHVHDSGHALHVESTSTRRRQKKH